MTFSCSACGHSLLSHVDGVCAAPGCECLAAVVDDSRFAVRPLPPDNPLFGLEFRFGVYDDLVHRAVGYFYDFEQAVITAAALEGA